MTIAFLGPLCALGSSFTWAVGSAGYSQLSKNNSAFAVNFMRALIAFPLFILASFIVAGGISPGIESFQTVRASHWGWFTLSMVASFGLGDSLFLLSTRSLGVPGALAIASCYPIWTVMAGHFSGCDPVSLSQIFGLLVAVSGIVVVILNAPKREDSSGQAEFSWKGVFLALATSFAWATNGFAVSRGGADLVPPVGNTIRMLLALVLSAGFGRLLAPRSPILLPRKEVVRFGWLFILEAFGGSYLYMYGLSHSPLALGSTLASLAPVISVPAAWLFGLEKFSLYRTLGVCLVVLGICFLVGAFSH